MSTAMAGGMTLVMSVWDDHYANMLWLDSTYPTTKTGPGGPVELVLLLPVSQLMLSPNLQELPSHFPTSNLAPSTPPTPPLRSLD